MDDTGVNGAARRRDDAGEHRCHECGAPLPAGASCREHLYAVLTLEASVPEAPGAIPHFLAVACYNLQHPSGFTVPTLLGLRGALNDVLAGRATLDDVRRSVGARAAGAVRIRNRPGDERSAEDHELRSRWPRSWRVTAADVSPVDPSRYVTSVQAWAAAVSEGLDAALGRRP